MAVRNSAQLAPELDLVAAHEHVAGAGLRPAPAGQVGLELEFHVVDHRHAQRRISYPELASLITELPPLPGGSAVTVEPGGQLELSGPPAADIDTAIARLLADELALSSGVRARGFGLASIGADPARDPHRISPVPRYAAMEQHFNYIGCGRPGRQMMSATASLQVNVNAGPASRWPDRLRHIHHLGPTVMAISACSPYLARHATGWRSMRQQAWFGIDAARTRPIPDSADPGAAWAEYALAAPVMLIRSLEGDEAESVTHRMSFADWVNGDGNFSRRATVEDLDYHLSTLFPPVRPRGYLELRYLDAVPRAWWPALAAIVATLIDDPAAADDAADAVAGVEQAWIAAARDGLGNPGLHRAAQRCMEIAARRCPPTLRRGVETYAELVDRSLTPGDLVRDAVMARGPLAALLEASHA